jgi:hypothetical protein
LAGALAIASRSWLSVLDVQAPSISGTATVVLPLWPEPWLESLQPDKAALHRAKPTAVPIHNVFFTTD